MLEVLSASQLQHADHSQHVPHHTASVIATSTWFLGVLVQGLMYTVVSVYTSFGCRGRALLLYLAAHLMSSVWTQKQRRGILFGLLAHK
jgi:hypothetical protein